MSQPHGKNRAQAPSQASFQALAQRPFLCLYQPDIPQNTGTLIRLAACMGVGIHVIEPCGFIWNDRHLRRAGMDYIDHAHVTRHMSWRAFLDHVGPPRRVIMLTRYAQTLYTDFAFRRTDTLLLGRESSGIPDTVAAQTHARVRIPMTPGTRSLNVALAGAMVLGEALRQTGTLNAPGLNTPE